MSWSARTRRLVWLVGLGALLASGAGASYVLSHSRTSSDPDTRPSTPSEPERVVCFGFVDAPDGVQPLIPLQAGRVVEVLIKEGDPVQKGDALLKLDDTVAKLRLQEAQAALQAAEAQLDQAEKAPSQHDARQVQQNAAIEATERRLSAARHGLQRKRDLNKINQLSNEETAAAEELVQELEAALKAERAKLDELNLVDPQVAVTRARAEVEAARARVAQAEKAVAECVLKAPGDGTVLRLQASAGDVLGPETKKPPMMFCPAGPRIVRAEVEQEFAPRVAVGQSALIRDDIKGDATWSGKVKYLSDWFTHRRAIILEPLQFNDVRTLECIVELDPNQPPLRIGQRVRVTIPGR